MNLGPLCKETFWTRLLDVIGSIFEVALAFSRVFGGERQPYSIPSRRKMLPRTDPCTCWVQPSKLRQSGGKWIVSDLHCGKGSHLFWRSNWLTWPICYISSRETTGLVRFSLLGRNKTHFLVWFSYLACLLSTCDGEFCQLDTV